MSFSREEGLNQPFAFPYLVAMAAGLPLALLWMVVATQIGILASLITLLLACACAIGARTACPGWNPRAAAVTATLSWIILTLSAIALTTLGSFTGQKPWDVLITMILIGDFTPFANVVLAIPGKTAASYPISMILAYRIANHSPA